LSDDLFEFGFVLRGTASSWFGCENARGLGLTDTVARVRLDCLRSRKRSWLAFRHGKVEYEVD